MTRQITQITTTAHGATKRTYDKVLKRFSDDGILSAIYALSSSVAKQRFVDPARASGSAVEPSHFVARPLRVIRVILTVRRSLPVYPDKQTISEPVGTSHLCQMQTLPRGYCSDLTRNTLSSGNRATGKSEKRSSSRPRHGLP